MPRRILQHTIILAFLLITVSGIVYTVFRVQTPVPWVLTRSSHASMAPFQGINPFNTDLRAEGLSAAGAWEPIDLGVYLPSSRGRRAVRLSLLAVAEEDKAGQYRQLAALLLESERTRGHEYESIRLIADAWPASAAGFEARRQEPDLISTEVAHVP